MYLDWYLPTYNTSLSLVARLQLSLASIYQSSINHPSVIHPPTHPSIHADHILKVADPTQLNALKLDKAQLWAIADVTDAYGSAAKQYEACGTVAKIDVFYATPLRSVSSSRQEWLEKYLSYWRDFSREEVCF